MRIGDGDGDFGWVGVGEGVRGEFWMEKGLCDLVVVLVFRISGKEVCGVCGWLFSVDVYQLFRIAWDS